MEAVFIYVTNIQTGGITMGNLQNILSTVFGLAITYLVPAVVWVTLIAGLYQLVRDEIRQIHVVPRRLRRLVQEGYSQ